MSRRRSEIEFSMFPFLSVLCAVIGILMLLLIAVMSTRVIALDASLWPEESSTGSETRSAGMSEEQYEALSAEVERLADRLAECNKRRREAERIRSQIEDLIAAKEDLQALGSATVRQEGTRLGVEAVRVIPDPNRKIRKEPILMEVRGTGLVVHPDQQKFAVDELERGDSPLRRFLAEIDAARQQKYLVLLLHPGGVLAYKRLRGFLEEHYGEEVSVGQSQERKSRIDLGVEPFSDSWLLEGR